MWTKISSPLLPPLKSILTTNTRTYKNLNLPVKVCLQGGSDASNMCCIGGSLLDSYVLMWMSCICNINVIYAIYADRRVKSEGSNIFWFLSSIFTFSSWKGSLWLFTNHMLLSYGYGFTLGNFLRSDSGYTFCLEFLFLLVGYFMLNFLGSAYEGSHIVPTKHPK